MANPVPPQERNREAPRPPKRQVTLPGSAKPQKEGIRGGLLLLGLLLVLVSGGGFWYILQTVDQRQEYLMAARTIERWEIVEATDFVIVEANVGEADALAPEYAGLVLDSWASGRIPAGTLVTVDMFESPPLANEGEADKVLIEVTLPAGEAPGGVLETGDKVALFGAEPAVVEGVEPAVELIGVLSLEYVEGEKISYVVTPEEAKAIHDVVDRYQSAQQRRIWKVGFDLPTGDLDVLYGGSPGAGGFADLGVLPEVGVEP